MNLKVGERVTYAFPGKTFLAGEYLALAGGPSLVLATGPAFEFVVERIAGEGPLDTHPFAAQSPAGLWLARFPELLRTHRISFRDPHAGRGGLGASTAQFAGAWVFTTGMSAEAHTQVPANENRFASFDWARLLRDYHSVAWNGQGVPPSGADLVTQLVGGVTWFDGVAQRAGRLEWNFPQLEFTLIRTGQKLATHEHLRSSGLQSKAALHEALRPAVELAKTAIEAKNENTLVEAVSNVESALSRAGLTASGTLELLARLKSVPGLVRAAKGCGAMGADVVLALHDRSQRTRVAGWAESQGLRTCGTSADLTAGLLVRMP